MLLKKLYPIDTIASMNSRLFKANKSIHLPRKKAYHFSLPEGVNKQANRFIFVFTKDKREFKSNTTGELNKLKEITKWINDIPPEMRIVRYKHFDIVASNRE